MLIPVVQFLAVFLVLALFAGLAFAFGPRPGSATDSTTANAIGPLTIVALLAMYFVTSVVATYFFAALVVGADQALRGGQPSFAPMFGAVNARLGRVVEWSALLAVVKLVLGLLRRNGGAGGAIGAGIGGAAWNVVTFLAVPVIVHEDLGPIRALKRSGKLLRQTWGENLAAQVGFGLLGVLAFLPCLLLFAIGAAAANAAVSVALGGIAFIWLSMAAAFISTLTGVYRAALYRYAVDGAVPPAFAGAGLERAFGGRNRGLGRVPSQGM